jgi:hypothetical protein
MINRRGFAWYEMLMTLAMIGSVTALAVPMSESYKRDGIASAVLSDIDSVRAGVFRFYSDSGYFPAQAGFSTIPEALVPYLPAGFSFTRTYGTLNYKTWVLSTSYSETVTSNVVGVSVVTKDPRVGAAAMERFGENPKFSFGSNRMFLIFGG